MGDPGDGVGVRSGGCTKERLEEDSRRQVARPRVLKAPARTMAGALHHLPGPVPNLVWAWGVPLSLYLQTSKGGWARWEDVAAEQVRQDG